MKLIIVTTKDFKDAELIAVKEWEKKPIIVSDIWNYGTIMEVDVSNSKMNEIERVWLNFD